MTPRENYRRCEEHYTAVDRLKLACIVGLILAALWFAVTTPPADGAPIEPENLCMTESC